MAPNPFLSSGKPDQESEQILQAKPALDDVVVKAYRVYEGWGIPSDYDYIIGLEKQILLPNQIDSLLQVIKSETEPEKLNDGITGFYLSRLIQDSYDAGNNEFVLTTEDTHINNLGYNIGGAYRRKLKLSINGNAGRGCGENAKYSKITISRNIEDSCGVNAEYSEITLLGTVNCCWNGMGAIKTTFTVHNEQAYDAFKMYMGDYRGNRLRLVNSKGKIIRRIPRWPQIHF